MLIHVFDTPEVLDKENAVVLRALVRRDVHGDDLSITWAQLDGEHPRLSTSASTRAYYILDGEGTFELGDETPIGVGAHDVIVVPPGVIYGYRGKMTLLIINAPAFAPTDDVFV